MPRGDGKNMYGKPRKDIKRTDAKPQPPSARLRQRLADFEKTRDDVEKSRFGMGYHRPGSQR